MEEALRKLLKQYWAHANFRPLQLSIISSIIEGKDTLAVLPTGAGKSLCYQLPALHLKGCCIVISPLIALMQDQVESLQKKNISATFLHSGLNEKAIHEVIEGLLNNAFKILYISPERLASEQFQSVLQDIDINFIAVDEAHCISQWGHSFRPSYRKINILRKELGIQCPIIALTASATHSVREDIILQLTLKSPSIFEQSIVRDNLIYHIQFSEKKPTDIIEIAEQYKGTGIIYCKSRKRTIDLSMHLGNHGINSLPYHAGLPQIIRENNQRQWLGFDNWVMCATNAFGMGIDKPNVRLVSHYDVPDNLENYYQEAGRAGRDNLKANAVLLYNNWDIAQLQQSIDLNFPPIPFLIKVYNFLLDYLNIAVGSGEETFRIFDIVQFCKNFKLDIVVTINAVKLLERQELWDWQEDAQTQSTIIFTVGMRTIEHLKDTHPKLYLIAINLLRLYGGIINYPTVVNEYNDAKFMRMTYEQLTEGLHHLTALSIINYRPAKKGSGIFLLQPRYPDHYIPINKQYIAKLKLMYKTRVESMLSYLSNTNTCRNKLLAAYFDENTTQIKDCMECDNCKRNNHILIKETDLISLMKTRWTENKKLTLNMLLNSFEQHSYDHVLTIIRQLVDDRFISVNHLGEISFSKP